MTNDLAGEILTQFLVEVKCVNLWPTLVCQNDQSSKQ